MLATILHAPGDVRVEERDEPKILKPTDAIIRLSATCICGSDLWPFRGLNEIRGPMAIKRPWCFSAFSGGKYASFRVIILMLLITTKR